ncbi:MAG: AAA family ATPase [Bacteroidota bacterium]
MLARQVYIAATDQNVGKTTLTLGLINHLIHQGVDVGFCKPVGQELVESAVGKLDKDIALFANHFRQHVVPHIHSPVILGRGVVNTYLDNPEHFCFEKDIRSAAAILEARHEFVVYEGTGHSGVGNVVGLSNARVAQILQTPVILIAEAGIGSTLDKLIVHIDQFRKYGVPILGVILNKTREEKREKVCKYVKKVLDSWGISLLGALPFKQKLEMSANNKKIKAHQEDKINTILHDFATYISLPALNYRHSLAS